MIIQTKESAIITGSIGKEPESKLVGINQKKIVNLSVAVDKIQDNTVWVNCYAWGSMLSSLKKGDKVLMTGKKEIQTYKSQDGSEKNIEKIKVDFFIKMQNTTTSDSSQNIDSNTIQNFEPIEDSELPF